MKTSVPPYCSVFSAVKKPNLDGFVPERLVAAQEDFRKKEFSFVGDNCTIKRLKRLREPLITIIRERRRKDKDWRLRQDNAETINEELCKLRIECNEYAEEARKLRDGCGKDNVPLMMKCKGKSIYRDDQITATYGLLSLCRERGIFVVVCITPEWYGQLNFTQQDLAKPSSDRYIQLLQEINERPDCSVIIARDFEEITDEGTDEDYLLDYGHMTERGAKVYTNWLLDRLIETPKTAEALRRDTAVR